VSIGAGEGGVVGFGEGDGVMAVLGVREVAEEVSGMWDV